MCIRDRITTKEKGVIKPDYIILIGSFFEILTNPTPIIQQTQDASHPD